MSRARGACRLLVLLAGALMVLLPALPAQAHDRLEASSPADGAVLDVAPTSLVLTFTAPALALGSRVVVTGPTGAVVSTGDPVFTDSTVTQALGGELPAGEYRVQWRVTSSDGHPVSGELAYTASAPAAGSASTAPDPTAAASPPPATSPSAASSAAGGPPSPVTAPASSTAPADGAGTPPWAVALAAAVLAALVTAAVAAVRRRRRT